MIPFPSYLCHMKGILICILTLPLTLLSQNLVPNASFEDTLACPDSEEQLSKTKYWFTPLYFKSTDFLHSCDLSGIVGVPNNNFGFQTAKNGSAYIGFILCSSVFDYREYASVELIGALEKNSYYEISFWLSLSNFSKYAVSAADVGVYFSNDSIHMPQSHYSKPLPYVPQAVAGGKNKMLKDTSNWMQVKFIYKANGNENYINIGNFNYDSATTYRLVNNSAIYNAAYYHLDQVSIVKVTDQYDLAIDTLIKKTSICYSDTSKFELIIQNTADSVLDFTVDTVTFTAEVEVNGAVVQNLEFELADNNSNPVPGKPLAPDSFMSIEIFPIDLSNLGQIHELTVTSFFKRDEDNSNDTASISLKPILDIGDISVFPDEACSGEEVILQTQGYIGKPVWQYSTDGQNWFDLSPGASAVHYPEFNTYYRLEICGFLESDSILVQLNDVEAIDDYTDTVCGIGTYKLQPIVYPDIENLFWYSDSNALETIHEGLSYTSFFRESQILFVQSLKNACFSEELARVKLVVLDCPLIIPNVFTPNGDGINDLFFFQNTENKKLLVKIYNRWGEMVESWQGNYSWDGYGYSDGVYYYVVQECQGGNVKIHKGKVTLLR